jgi:hypothetical protein
VVVDRRWGKIVSLPAVNSNEEDKLAACDATTGDDVSLTSCSFSS